MIATSRFFSAGPLREFLPESPKVPGAHVVNAAGLKYWCSHCASDPRCTLRGTPGTRSARQPLSLKELSGEPMLKGRPEDMVRIPDTSQCPSAPAARGP